MTDRRDGVAALDGAGAAGRRGLTAAASDLEGGGGRKEGQSGESESSDTGEHVGSGEQNATGDARGLTGVDLKPEDLSLVVQALLYLSGHLQTLGQTLNTAPRCRVLDQVSRPPTLSTSPDE